MFVQNWQMLDVPYKAGFDGHSGQIIAWRANRTRCLFRPDVYSADIPCDLDVSTEKVEYI